MPFPKAQTEIIGNLGKDAEMRYSPQGKAVTQFSVAVTRKWKQGEQEVKETSWYQVTCWEKLAEMTANLRKGQQVFVVGRLVPDKATGGPRIWSRQDGSQGASYELTASEVWLSLFSAGDSTGANIPEEIPDEDSIPF